MDRYPHLRHDLESMSLGYDIFRKLDDGTPLWIADLASLSEAKEKIQLLVSQSAAAYFIRDASTGKVVFSIPPGD
jgi:hypothetical protein